MFHDLVTDKDSEKKITLYISYFHLCETIKRVRSRDYLFIMPSIEQYDFIWMRLFRTQVSMFS
jgi:hypothetical protein